MKPLRIDLASGRWPEKPESRTPAWAGFAFFGGNRLWLSVLGLVLVLPLLAHEVAYADTRADAETGGWEPERIVRKTTEDLLSALHANPEIYKTDRQKLMELVDEVLMPSLDFSLTSRLVMGRHWRKADAGQRKRFVQLFRDMLLRTYTHPLLEYADDVDIVFQPSGKRSEDDRTTVRTTLSFSGSEPVPVHYAMLRRERGWKVYDVLIGGISAVVTFRSSFGEDIRKHGIEGFLKRLEAHNARLLENERKRAEAGEE